MFQGLMLFVSQYYGLEARLDHSCYNIQNIKDHNDLMPILAKSKN